MTSRTRQHSLSFRFEKDEFKVILEDSTSSEIFFNFLKSIHLVTNHEVFETWFNTITDDTLIQCFTSTTSLNVRKKAEQLRLSMVQEKSFLHEKEEDYKRSRKETFNV